jgi:hypothetical protein
MIQLPDIAPGETPVITFKFGREMLPGETLASCSVFVAVVAGVDPNPQGILFQQVDMSQPPNALQQIRPTIDGVTYLLVAKGTLNTTRVIFRQGQIRVALR